jgi:hypothetical protein
MVHGDKTLTRSAEASRDDGRSRLLGAIILAACATLVAWLVEQAK